MLQRAHVNYKVKGHYARDGSVLGRVDTYTNYRACCLLVILKIIQFQTKTFRLLLYNFEQATLRHSLIMERRHVPLNLVNFLGYIEKKPMDSN